jgi:ESF2/ABP1 family protein
VCDTEDTGSMSDSESHHSNDKKSRKSGALIKEAERYKESLEKRGVLYMSRVPPFMKPNKARDLFEQYGEVTRLFLQEEGIILYVRPLHEDELKYSHLVVQIA